MFVAITLILSLLLDGILTNYLPFLVNDLSLFTPLFTLVSIFIIYPFYRKNEKKYFIIVIIIGLLYDLFYTNLLFLNAILFFIIGLLTKYLYKNLETSHLKLLIYIPIIIAVYESLTAIVLFTFNIVPITFSKLGYKIVHSLILNIIYGEIIYFISNIVKRKKKISIN